MELIVGIGNIGGCLAGAVTTHILMDHVAADVILKGILLLLHVLLGGIGILNGGQLTDGIVVVILLPAIGVVHVGDTAHPIVLVGGGAAILFNDLGKILHQVVFLGGNGAVRIGHAGLV